MNTITWPPERLYWAVVEAPGGGWRRTGPIPPALLSPLADELPLDLEIVHAVCAPLDPSGTRVVICAAPREALSAIQPGVLSLLPASLPEFIQGDVDPLALNLLVGEFEPLPLRRERSRRHAFAAAAVLLCSILVTIGLQRRAAAWYDAALGASTSARTVLAQAGPPMTRASLTTELARLRLQRTAMQRAAPPVDASVSLARFLNAWPAAVPAEPQSLSIGEATATLSVSLEGDPAPFLRAMTPPAGWMMDDPRLNSSGDLTRLTLQFRQKAAGGKP